MRKLACGVFAAGVATSPAMAAADDPVEPVRMEVDADVACSNDHLFFDEVRARTARVRWADPGEHARTFRVRIKDEGGASVGTLTIVDEAKASAPRTFKAEGCKAVIEALAFVAAVSIDPAAQREAVLALPPAPALPPPAPPPPPEWPVEPPEGTPPLGGNDTAPVKPSPRAPETSKAPPRTTDEGWLLALGAGATVAGPDTLATDGVGGRAFVEVGRVLSGGRLVLAPTARLSFDFSGSTTTQLQPASNGQASFTWIRGTADVCPLRLLLTATLYAAPCAGFEAGAIEASAPKTPHALPATTPWVALALAARLRLRFLRVLFAEVDPLVDVPFVRQQFKLVGSANDVYQAPPIYVGGFLALGVHFP